MLDTAALLAHTNDLELIVRHVLAGLGHGIHAGRERGAGVEFSEYRAYAPGDEWRRVDWKLLARADRYYVREAERDSHVATWLWLDATASMAEPSRQVPKVDKLRFAGTVLACIAAVAQRQGDAFGLVVCTDGKTEFTPASRGPRQLQRVLAQLAKARPQGAMPDAATLQSSLHFARAPSLVFAASDCLEWPSPLSEALLRLRHMQHDVRLLAVRTQAEVDASFNPGAGYRDPEGGIPATAARLHLLDETGRAAYRAALTAHFAAVGGTCRQHDIPYYEARIEQPLAAVLRGWLQLASPRARAR
ncbi:hypothetical protein ASD15_30515 [Massilia sp. Root351]|uniref:DUF58 domain-containing protein n=1 Tax=Massilia sp. Root351 TaxID=1736522 RepID=UPI0007101DF3|nr:DUF58 domain-containing protein [Massilia sp. Root351]KQV85366.1 hypothetical protein ASD15_30515 [Massilia sp. Root351]